MKLEIVSSSVRNAKSGGIVPFKTWATAQGVDLTNKDARKSAMKEYDREKRSVLTENRRLMAAVATDTRFDVRKFQIKRDAKGEVIGYDIAGRAPTKAELKASQKLDAEAKAEKIRALEGRLAALLEKLAAVGIDPADLDKVPALTGE